MNYIFDEDTGVNRENYEMLAVAIITQAIRDLENGLALNKRLKGREPKSKYDIRVRYLAVDAEVFLQSQWFYELCKSKDMDGRTILKKCKNNFNKYGKCYLTKEEWEKVEKGMPLGKGRGKQTVYLGGVK